MLALPGLPDAAIRLVVVLASLVSADEGSPDHEEDGVARSLHKVADSRIEVEVDDPDFDGRAVGVRKVVLGHVTRSAGQASVASGLSRILTAADQQKPVVEFCV